MNGKVNRSLPHDHDSFVCGEIHEKASKIRMFREYENFRHPVITYNVKISVEQKFMLSSLKLYIICRKW